jgi:large subunit ribosomal protein L9
MIDMQVIMKQDVQGIGKTGEKVTVMEGYARNFLFPRKLAVEATPGAIKDWENQKASQAKKEAKILAEAQESAKKMETMRFVVKAKTGTDGRLFGTVTNKEIAETVAKETGLKFDKRKIELSDPIKTLGAHPFVFKVHPQVSATLKIHVEELK